MYSEVEEENSKFEKKSYIHLAPTQLLMMGIEIIKNQNLIHHWGYQMCRPRVPICFYHRNKLQRLLMPFHANIIFNDEIALIKVTVLCWEYGVMSQEYSLLNFGNVMNSTGKIKPRLFWIHPVMNVVYLLSLIWLFCKLMDYGLPGSSIHGFPSKNTRVGCHFLLQGIFLNQGLNPHLTHLLNWQEDSLSLSHLEC